MTTSDKIDRIVTNRWLALPIFAVVMWVVYYVSVTTVGTFVTDWTNDVLFGEIIPPAIENLLNAIHCADWLQGWYCCRCWCRTWIRTADAGTVPVPGISGVLRLHGACCIHHGPYLP